MRILICGGGVAGLTLAYWLRRRGFEPVVVEHAPHGRLGGYGIDFFGTGYDIAGRMGILDALRPHRLPIDSIEFVHASGRPATRLPTSLLDKVIPGPHMALMHDVLEGALLDAVQDEVEIRYQETVIGVRSRSGAVDVDFASGGTESFRLLVGADGIHSVVRDLVFGPAARFARQLGRRLACYPVPDRYGLGRVRAHYIEQGRQVVTYPTERPGELIALFLFAADDAASVPRDRRRGLLRETFDGMGWITSSLLADAPENEPIFMDTMTQIVMPSWHRGRVVLVGDACGCMTMLSAQGVSMAMGGAYLLAEALQSEPDHTRAFRRYQGRMHAQVSRRQCTAHLSARSIVPSGRAGMIANRLLTRLVTRPAFAPVLRRQFGTGTILPPAEAARPS